MSLKNIISLEKRRKIANVYEGLLRKFAKKSYSQEGEDMILNRVFEKLTKGFYIDVGAYHPYRFSNTYYFYRKGWRGINIDAMPGSMKTFMKTRPRDINLEIPVSSVPSNLMFYIFNEPALNTFSKETAELRNGKDGFRIVSRENVSTQTLKDILKDNLPSEIIEIQFMSIDVENLDYDVLSSNDWNSVRPLFVLIEDLQFDINNLYNSNVYKLFKSVGYDFFGKTVNTIFYKRNDFIINK